MTPPPIGVPQRPVLARPAPRSCLLAATLGGDAYLFGAFVYLEIGLFMIFGPDVRIPILLNAALAIVTALLIFDATRRLFGSTVGLVAAAIVAFFPSLILWSALNLKDSLTTTLTALAIWAAVRFQFRPRLVYFAVQFATAQALITLRSYVAATIAIVALLAIPPAGLSPRRRVGAIALASVLTAVIIIQGLNAIGSGIGEQLVVAFERERAVMAIGARTGSCLRRHQYLHQCRRRHLRSRTLRPPRPRIRRRSRRHQVER
jgi:hypothetical protein